MMFVAFVVAVWLLLLAAIADVWTTVIGLRAGLVERNPLVRWATTHWMLVAAVKSLFICFSVWMFTRTVHVAPVATIASVLACAILTAFVALRNLRLVAVLRDE